MPELPEVETVCRALGQKLIGRKLTKITVRRPDLRFPLPQDFSRRLVGARILKIYRRAKYMIWEFDNGQALIGHLGMSGRMTFVKGKLQKPDRHDHVLFETHDGAVLCYNDPRRFGMMDLVDQSSTMDHPLLRHLGKEPLERDFNATFLEQALKAKKTTIKTALLDQRIVVGLGNIYVCEALFRARLSPKRKASSIKKEEIKHLIKAIKAVLREAIAAGGSSLRDYVQVNGELGYFQHRWRIYDREGGPCYGCICDSKHEGGVKRIVQAGRSTYYCPRLQK